MTVSNKDVLKLRSEICCNFGNPQYLAVSGERDFDNVRGTRLWLLWYGDKKLSIANMDAEYNRYLAGKCSAKQFYKRLRHLKRCFKYEFFKIKIKKIMEELNYD